MPRKTRKQKLNSEARKKQITPISFKLATSASPIATSSPPAADLFIRRDIRKTAILGALFILFELMLSIISKNLGW